MKKQTKTVFITSLVVLIGLPIVFLTEMELFFYVSFPGIYSWNNRIDSHIGADEEGEAGFVTFKEVLGKFPLKNWVSGSLYGK